MKLISCLLPAFALGATSALISPSRYGWHGDETARTVAGEKPAQWLAIQEPGRHHALGADDDVPAQAAIKRSVDDENPEENPAPKRRRPRHNNYLKEWRARRLRKLNAPETPAEEKARLQATIDKERHSMSRMNRYISLEEAEKVLSPEEMERFRTLREAHNRFRRANKAMKRTMREAKKAGRRLTKAELAEWDEILAGNRAHSKMAREVARRLDAREEGEREAQPPSPEMEAQQKRPQAPNNVKGGERRGDTSSDIHPFGLTNNPFLGVKKMVRKTGSGLGGSSRLGNAVQRAASALRHHAAGSRPVSPNVGGPVVPIKGPALLWKY